MRKIYSISVFITIVSASIAAVAQEKFQLPPHKAASAEFVQRVAAQAKLLNASALKDSSAQLRAKALVTRLPNDQLRTRGPKDVLIFRNAAPSVVLLLLDGGICSGSLLKNNLILTAAHCVEDEKGQVINSIVQELTGIHVVREVVVVFKPSDQDGKPQKNEVVMAAVHKIDHKRELALLRLLAPLPRELAPLEISPADVEVGADVHAIGHPHGYNWTYTKGFVSQVRVDRSWKYRSSSFQRQATVIQTQTPINGGNSGGPLLSDEGKIVGVAVGGEPNAENINFAISSNEISAFLSDPSNVVPTCDGPRALAPRQHDAQGKVFVTRLSARCDVVPDFFVLEPDDQKEPFRAIVRSRKNDKQFGEIFGDGRTGKWSESAWDINFDNTFPLVGLHREGTLLPTIVGSRCPRGSKPIPDGCSRI